MSSRSMGGAQAAVLDYAADSNGESPFPETSQCGVMRGSQKKVWPDPMWEATKWLEMGVGGRCPEVAAGCAVDGCRYPWCKGAC